MRPEPIVGRRVAGPVTRTGTLGDRRPVRPYPDARLPIAGETWDLQFEQITGFNRKRQEYIAAPAPWGSGHRLLVIVAVGRKWIEALPAADPDLRLGRLHVEDWRAYGPRLEDGNVAGGLKRIEKTRRQLKRAGAWTGADGEVRDRYRTRAFRAAMAALQRAAGVAPARRRA